MVLIWVKRSLRYYGARHLAFAGTAALAAAILSAALLTGESLQEGLRRGLVERLGRVRSAVFLAEGLFPASLAQRLPGAQAALLLRGELLTGAGAVCANRAQIIGAAGGDGSRGAPQDGWAATLNARGRAGLPEDEAAVRFEKPPLFSVEMPLGAVKEARLVRRAVRLEGARPAGAPALPLMPDFALRAASVPPVNVFLPHGPLSEAAGVPGMANLLVSEAEPGAFERALAAALTPEDLGLVLERVREPPVAGRGSAMLVKSRRVFLPQAVGAALAKAGLPAEPATFHLADAFEAGAKATPYGFVAAGAPDGVRVPPDLKDDEVVVNAWLAETLGVSAGQTVTLRWRRFESGGRLVADSRAFRVREVIPAERAAAAKAAMPVFPGLAGVDSCAAWDVGLPMDEEKLKDPANEAYWKQWRETPKAFLTFAAGRACFGAAFGEAMCLRVAADEAAVRKALAGLAPAEAGFVVRPVWKEGLAVAQGSTDFKGLFAGFAFVLMASALLLAALSLSLALEARKSEVALFRALGWSRGRIAAALAAEWSVPLAAGAAVGAGLGAALARALVWSLGRFWSGAFAGAKTDFHFSLPVAGAAAGVSVALAAGVLVWTAWRFARCRPVELWQTAGRGGAGFRVQGPAAGPVWEHVAGATLAAAACAVMALVPEGAANGAFFGAGFLLLVSLLLLVRAAGAAWLWRGEPAASSGPVGAGVRRALGSPRQSAPVVILLAVGTFLTVGILSMKHDPAAGCHKSSSGSGGFAAIVTSVAPLDRERGLELARRASGAKGVVPVRVHEGDEAGCLNMNQPVSPQVVGLDARAMARARAFEPEDSGGVRSALQQRLPDGAVPALAADQTMLQYSLKAQADAREGTVYAYAGPSGRAARVRIVGALPVRSGILQGAVIVDEKFFTELFPDEAGYRLWLCDAAPPALRLPGADLRLRHPEPGVTVETAEERLRLLGSVESTYLDLFLVLGGLGVVLGAAGVGLVVLRGVQERRGELALLSAVGLPRGAALRLLAAEYGVMVLAGLAVGLVPALVAIQPAARSLRGALPWMAMAGVVAGLFLCAAVCVFAAARIAARRYGPEVLKEQA